MNVQHDLDEPIAVTVPGAARALGLGVSTVRERIRDGRLRALKDGERVVVPVEELRRYLQALEAA